MWLQQQRIGPESIDAVTTWLLIGNTALGECVESFVIYMIGLYPPVHTLSNGIGGCFMGDIFLVDCAVEAITEGYSIVIGTQDKIYFFTPGIFEPVDLLKSMVAAVTLFSCDHLVVLNDLVRCGDSNKSQTVGQVLPVGLHSCEQVVEQGMFVTAIPVGDCQ